MFHPKQGVGFLRKEVSAGLQKSLVMIKRSDGSSSCRQSMLEQKYFE